MTPKKKPIAKTPMTPATRFIKLDDAGNQLPPNCPSWSQVLDTQTNLIWAADASTERVVWKDATKTAEATAIGETTGWRVPTIRELLDLVDYDKYSPAIDTSYFRCESAWHWSSTPVASAPRDYAWAVDFYDGDSYWFDQDNDAFVRAVRSASASQ